MEGEQTPVFFVPDDDEDLIGSSSKIFNDLSQPMPKVGALSTPGKIQLQAFSPGIMHLSRIYLTHYYKPVVWCRSIRVSFWLAFSSPCSFSSTSLGDRLGALSCKNDPADDQVSQNAKTRRPLFAA